MSLIPDAETLEVDMTTPKPDPFGELKRHFSYAKHVQGLQQCLGLFHIFINDHGGDPTKSEAQFIARQLAKHTILITIDCEHYTLNSSELTEIGVATVKRTDVAHLSESGFFGDHGENLMRQVKFHLLRLKEKAHMLTSNPGSKGPDGNRFGEGRFVSFEEARVYLHKLLVQPITGVKALQGYNHPIVIMGHAVGHDREHLMGKDLGFNMGSLGTIVKFIDTQAIARELGFWLEPMADIGLDKLVAKLEFEHTDPHTAANDAARTLLCGMLMVVGKDVRMGCSRSIEQVVEDLEHYSRNTFVGHHGTRQYCFKCGSTEHMHADCNEPKNKLQCSECASRGLVNDNTIDGHITLHCPIKRDEVAAERLKWFADQNSGWKPKWAFDSSYFLQTFVPNAPPINPPTNEEMNACRSFYRRNRGPWSLSNVFTSVEHSFRRSPLRNLGAPTREDSALPRDAVGLPIYPPSADTLLPLTVVTGSPVHLPAVAAASPTIVVAPPSPTMERDANFPPLPPPVPSGRGSWPSRGDRDALGHALEGSGIGGGRGRGQVTSGRRAEK